MLEMRYHIIATQKQNWQKTWTKIGTFANCALMDICCIAFVFCLPSSQGDAQNTNHTNIIKILPNTCSVEKLYLLGGRQSCQEYLYHIVCSTYEEA